MCTKSSRCRSDSRCAGCDVLMAPHNANSSPAAWSGSINPPSTTCCVLNGMRRSRENHGETAAGGCHTGADGGIGQALVKTFAREGYRWSASTEKPRMRKAEWITFDLAKLARETTGSAEFIQEPGLSSVRAGRCSDQTTRHPDRQAGEQSRRSWDWDQTLSDHLWLRFCDPAPAALLRRSGAYQHRQHSRTLTKSNFSCTPPAKRSLVG